MVREALEGRAEDIREYVAVCATSLANRVDGRVALEDSEPERRHDDR